ncbi:hypothetical protein MIND_01068400 [Mycena indigotica]|uniref:Uncharacterized protein n=1 Tax=Mycena indigotica TaxID=2126181 RepID=A0A8H6VXA4_9AGAR|nr:uncharacterized protein MIND_01068400 [Mycena indigotica]KAF7295291.1 hypothetical protein MIND_01068400 [Mycena indigotica]
MSNSSSSESPHKPWTIWLCGDLVDISPPYDTPISKTLDALRYHILSSPILLDITDLTFDDPQNRASTPFRERLSKVSRWLMDDPPPIEFGDTGEAYANVICPDGSAMNVLGPVNQQHEVKCREQPRIRVAKRFYDEFARLNQGIVIPGSRDQACLNVLTFTVAWTILHKLAHAARSIIGCSPSPDNGMYRPVTGAALQEQVAHTSDRSLVRHGEHGWALERRTCGETCLVFNHNLITLSTFDAQQILGISVEVLVGQFHFISVNDKDVLAKLAAIDWKDIVATVKAQPAYSNLSTTSTTVLRSAPLTPHASVIDHHWQSSTTAEEQISPSPAMTNLNGEPSDGIDGLAGHWKGFEQRFGGKRLAKVCEVRMS